MTQEKTTRATAPADSTESNLAHSDAPVAAGAARASETATTQIAERRGAPTRLWRSGWLTHSARTAIAGGAALVCARLLRLPEAYWAPVTAIVVMQSTLGAAWDVSKQRFLGTALGAAAGGLLATYLAPRVLTFAVTLFALGVLCALLRLNQSAYRFAGITVAIVMLVERTSPPYLIAAHRFVEVSLGIAVALALTAVWPGREEAPRS